MFFKRIGIDLGTISVLVFHDGRIVLQEPSMVALVFDEDMEREMIVAFGQEARDMFGRTPENVEVVRPLRGGVIADGDVTTEMLAYFINRLSGRVMRLFKPTVMISVPYGVTSVEHRAVKEAAIMAGARENQTHLLPQPLLTAVGAGLPVNAPAGNMVLSLGGGITEAAVVAMNGVVVAESVRVAGMSLDDAIINYVRRKYSLVIGEMTAEAVKIQIGTALPLEEEYTMEIQGRDQVGGLPRTITITSGEVAEAIAEPLAMIANCAKNVLEATPPELASDIIDRGICLTGGTALLRSIDRYITQETGVPAYVADEPIVCTAVGAGRALDNLEVLRRTIRT